MEESLARSDWDLDSKQPESDNSGWNKALFLEIFEDAAGGDGTLSVEEFEEFIELCERDGSPVALLCETLSSSKVCTAIYSHAAINNCLVLFQDFISRPLFKVW